MPTVSLRAVPRLGSPVSPARDAATADREGAVAAAARE